MERSSPIASDAASGEIRQGGIGNGTKWTRSLSNTIPTGSRPLAQGDAAGATLGIAPPNLPALKELRRGFDGDTDRTMSCAMKRFGEPAIDATLSRLKPDGNTPRAALVRCLGLDDGLPLGCESCWGESPTAEESRLNPMFIRAIHALGG